jgi:hypothetical protein
MVSSEEAKKNTRLTQFEDIKQVVVANAVKNVPELRKAKAQGTNRALSEF